MASRNLAIFVLGNGLSPDRSHTIAWTYADSLSMRNNFQWNVNKDSHVLVDENVFHNVVCKMVVISFKHQYVYGYDVYRYATHVAVHDQLCILHVFLDQDR